MCGGVNTRGGAEREARDKKRRRRARGSGGHVADIAEAERGAFQYGSWFSYRKGFTFLCQYDEAALSELLGCILHVAL